MAKNIISGSILSADFSNLSQQIKAAESAGMDWVHIDVMDGAFVPNISMGSFVVETCKRITDLPLDVHLMIEKPEKHIESFAKAGANWISVHIENSPNIHRTLQSIRSLGCHPGIVLNPGTPANSIASVIDLVDLILVMTVNPGFSGQKFIPEMMRKVEEIRTMTEKFNPEAIIQVDGGITAETLPLAKSAGAQCFVSATSIFKYPEGIAAGIQKLRESELN